LQYFARGLSPTEIAHAASISEHTVRRHSKNIMRKLDIHSRVELVRFAIREGLADA
jgi:DNA-binding NarL/FixJ family response regulator